MRIELQFITKINKFPLDYRNVFISFLKSCISKCNNGVYTDKYYEPGKRKEFSFAIFFQEPQFMQNDIQLESNKIKMIFSTSDKFTSFVFMSAFLENKNKEFPLENGNAMTLIKVNEINQLQVTNTQALFQTASPLCIRKHDPITNKDYYYSYANEKFKDIFLDTVTNQLKRVGFSEEYLKGFNIEPISCKKVIIKHYGCNIECTLGKIILEGNILILQYLLNSGIGSRCSSGFGLLELIANG